MAEPFKFGSSSQRRMTMTFSPDFQACSEAKPKQAPSISRVGLDSLSKRRGVSQS
jgi:hypothetical protein